METYDTDGNGILDERELEHCLSLKSAIERVDVNRDGSISADEIAERMKAYDGQSDFVGTLCVVRANKRPGAGVEVTLDPEPFMADALQLQSFTGVTNDEGMALLEGVQVKTPGLPLGFYRVRIASKTGGSETIRGCEIADDVPSVNQLIFSM